MPTSIEEAVQDPGFQAAPPTQQMAYLAHVDPDFKNAKAEDQLAYLNHITGKQAPTTADNSVEKGEAPALPNKATAFQKAAAIPAALAPDENFKPADALGRMASGAWSGLKAMNPFQGMPSTDEEKAAFVKEHTSPSAIALKSLGPAGELAKSGVEGYRDARSGGSGVIPSVGAGLANMFGLDTPGIKERASQGDVAGVIGEGIPAIAGTLLGGEAENIGKRLPTVKSLAAAPVRYAARTAEDLANSSLSPLRSVKGVMQPADEAVGMRIKVPGRDFGLPAVEEAKPFTPQGPQLPAENRTPGGLPVVSEKPLTLSNPDVGRETAIQPSLFPSVEGSAPAAAEAPGGMPKVASMSKLGDLIAEGAGTRPLEPAVPLKDQVGNFGGKITWRRDPIIKNVGSLEEGAGRAVAPEKIPAVLGNEVERAAGQTPEATDVEKQRLQTKYPDREIRQLVHANGEAMIDAIGDDRETMKAIHDLKNPDVRQAAMNLGENMVRDDGSPIMVNNRMLSGDISRQKMFERLLNKGYTPQEIIEAAHAELEPAMAGSGKPGPMRAAEQPRTREKTGD